MIVECPSCATRFNLDESRIGERGAKVRCSVCSHSFVVHASSPIGDEVTAVDPESIVPIPGGDTVTDVMPTEAVPTNRYDFTPFLSGTPPQAMQDLQPTVPGGPELVENDDIIEIGADEVDELSGYSSTGTIPTLDPSVGGHETVPGLSVSGVHSAPQTSVDPAEFLEIEEPSSPGGYYSAPPESMMTVQTSPGAFAVTSADVVDPFAPAEESIRPPNESLAPVETSSPPGTAGDFSVETKPHSNPLSLASNFESHSTAVFNVAQLAQSPEAMPDAPSLDADIPGGLGPSADQVGTGRAMLPRLTDSAFDGPPSRLRSVASMILTLLMLAGIIAGSVYTLVYTGRLDPDTVGLEGVVAAPSQELTGGYESVFPVTVRSVLYPSRLGAELLVFVGDVENLGTSEQDGLDVVARLVDAEGNIAASARAPIGVVFDVGELAEVADRPDVDGLIASKLASGLGGAIGPGEVREFMVVLPSPPLDVARFTQQIFITERPKPVVTEAAIIPPAAEVVGEGDESTARRKRKSKRPRRAARPE